MAQKIKYTRPLKILFFIAYLLIIFGLYQTNIERGLKILLSGVTIISLVILYIFITGKH